MAEKVEFIKTTQNKYATLTPDNYTFYYCTDTDRCFLGSNELTNDEDIQAVMAALSIVETKADNAQETADEAVTAASNAQSTADSAIKSVGASSPLSASTSAGAVTLTHSTSGVIAGSYGNSSAQTPAFGGTFSVNYETANDTGHLTAISSHNVTIPNTAATTSTAGLMSASDKTKLDGVATGATANTGTITGITTTSPLSGSGTSGSVALSHATSGVSSGTYGPTANSSPSAGGTFSVPSVTVDTYGHVTGASSRTITLPSVEGYQYATYTLPATVGWYRIASSPVSVTNNAGLFTIRGQVNGRHTTATMEAGISYNTAASASCNFLNVHTYSTNWLFSKVRIVYNTSYSGNYAYLEVYQASAYAGVYKILASNCVGWTLNTDAVEGEIPDGYTSKEFSLDTNGALIADTIVGDLTGNATTATTATNLGTATVGGAARGIYLNAGAPTACSSTVGSSTAPVYMSSGTITACGSSLAVDITGNAATATKVGTATVGSGTKPIYLSSGTATASSSTVGSSSQPVYLSSGTITACTDLSTTPQWEAIK